MRDHRKRMHYRHAIAATVLICLAGCRSPQRTDHPKLTPGTHLEDIRFHSDLLARDVTYRVISPAQPTASGMPVVYLLHGAGDDYTSWSAHSPIAELAQLGMLLVMPGTEGSLLVNTNGGKRFEDYVIDELIPNVRQHFPLARRDRESTAIVGISRGGFSSILLGLKHPQTFGYAAGISPAIDLAERSFRWRQFGLSMQLRNTFGPTRSEHRNANEPFLLLPLAPHPPYFFLACGNRDVLLGANRRFAKQLMQAQLPNTFLVADGGHDWAFWNSQLPALEGSLLAHLHLSAEPTTISRP